MSMSGKSMNGKWAGGSEISVNGQNVFITMGSRPSATGLMLANDPQVVKVQFPGDSRTYVGTLINDDQIQWCSTGDLWNDNVWGRES